MRLRTGRGDEEPELNLIPLIDVMLMTLVFLVITTSFSKEALLRIRLPEAQATASTRTPALRVAVDAQGRYFINDQQLLNADAERLRQAMQRAAGGQKDPLVVVHADAKTPHEAVVRVMEASRRLGYTHLSFATRPPTAANGGAP